MRNLGTHSSTALFGPEPETRTAGLAVTRARGVLRHDGRYLLAQPNSRRPANLGKWGLPGGRLKKNEEPKAGLRRELSEELRVRLPSLVRVGDWSRRNELHRVFGCNLPKPVDWFDTDELLAIAWFTAAEVEMLAAAERLHMGFELAAIRRFEQRLLATV